MINHRYI